MTKETKPTVTPVMRRVFYAPTAGRHYLTKRGAAHGEAVARIKRKHPTEPCESEGGNITFSGWHWHDLKRPDVLLRRYERIIFRSIANKPTP